MVWQGFQVRSQEIAGENSSFNARFWARLAGAICHQYQANTYLFHCRS
jgi:hypothetical protein